ncbi:MAG: cyclic nucleotide-binding domain-containing protein [bacterium]|nr:cyclic nucleotide-binding domain-containing protein [bacterium]
MKESGDFEMQALMEESFDAGDVIIREGEMGVMAYKIISGKVDVKKKCDDNIVTLATLEEGSVFGEMSLIDEKPHSATVTALTDVECICITRAAFENEISESSPIIKEIVKAFSHRLRGADDRICSNLNNE